MIAPVRGFGARLLCQSHHEVCVGWTTADLRVC